MAARRSGGQRGRMESADLQSLGCHGVILRPRTEGMEVEVKREEAVKLAMWLNNSDVTIFISSAPGVSPAPYPATVSSCPL